MHAKSVGRVRVVTEVVSSTPAPSSRQDYAEVGKDGTRREIKSTIQQFRRQRKRLEEMKWVWLLSALPRIEGCNTEEKEGRCK